MGTWRVRRRKSRPGSAVVRSKDAGASSTSPIPSCTRDNMDHIARNGGRFLTILPKTRNGDELCRAWIAGGAAVWEEIARRPGKRKDDSDEVYWAAEAPSCDHPPVWP